VELFSIETLRKFGMGAYQTQALLRNAFIGGVKCRSILHLRTNSKPSDTSDIPHPLFVHVLTLIFLSPLFHSVHPCLLFPSDPLLLSCDC